MSELIASASGKLDSQAGVKWCFFRYKFVSNI